LTLSIRPQLHVSAESDKGAWGAVMMELCFEWWQELIAKDSFPETPRNDMV